MQNFDYLKDIPELSQLHEYCEIVENRAYTEPTTSAIYARKALEWMVKTIYQLKDVEIKERKTLNDLINAPVFVEFINDSQLMRAVSWVQRLGNIAAHDGTVSRRDAFFTVLNLYNVIGGILLKLRVLSNLADFNGDLIPTREPRPRILVPRPHPEPEVFIKEVPTEAVAEAPTQHPALSWANISEAETRRYFIDLMLREAGWTVLEEEHLISSGNACIEIEVQGMPSASGIGYADYVLFGNNAKPLAVIEAKRTSVDPAVGKHQAELYADCLERKYGVRPVIYYTNGYEINVIDGLGYPPRQLTSFHSKKDLELLHTQRNTSLKINDFTINDDITNRPYQKRAIKSLCEWFNDFHRRGLLVMATGTGKTRTAISLVDVLQRNGRIKNVLFLADRSALVSQAFEAFNKHLPNTSTSRLDVNDTDFNARIIFSTYHSVMPYINGDEKPFSIGRFDLIIIDEAHRSVFGKFGEIFKYFDSLLVGLTATPREQIDKNTYELLEQEGGEPNFAYELQEAIDDGHLVDAEVVPKVSKILEEGIKYDDLSDEEKKQLEEIWEYEQVTKDPDDDWEQRDILPSELFNYIYNKDTVKEMLQDLMEKGLKIESGEKLGKTIIFAMNSPTAKLIVQCFNELYPELGPHFCEQIDYSVKYVDDLIRKFKNPESLPQIAVSVDMLDTGIDVPEILNLVFFKRVRSRIKFMQMIGRGTRKCDDIFGPGEHKEKFLIFDWGGNFKYFGQGYKESKSVKVISLTERLFGIRAEIACALQAQQYQDDAFAKGLHDELKQILQNQVAQLSNNYISVRLHWETVTKFKDPQTWQYISDIDVVDLKNEIAPLLVKSQENELAKKFDLLSLYVQLSMVDPAFESEKHQEQIRGIAEALSNKATIPEIRAKMGLLNEIKTLEFWENKTLASIENMRKQIRELMKFLKGEEGRTFTISIKDEITDGDVITTINSTVTYKQKVLDYLAQNRDNPVLNKIKNFEKLTNEDIDALEKVFWKELGTKEDYQKFLQREQLTENIPIGGFLRKVNGIDRKKAIELFTEFISANSLTAGQEEFINNIITYVSKNGDIERGIFTRNRTLREALLRHFRNNEEKVGKYIDLLHNLIITA